MSKPIHLLSKEPAPLGAVYSKETIQSMIEGQETIWLVEFSLRRNDIRSITFKGTEVFKTFMKVEMVVAHPEVTMLSMDPATSFAPWEFHIGNDGTNAHFAFRNEDNARAYLRECIGKYPG